ncbi:hypothetical protein IU418_09560 [Nocardia farcinica]|uniref:hypothetical protein n=1 Tax=Nocardia farcinica TaxID=37329 RepID=UPI001B3CA2BA|nr:hypothetical protein [Nocardia farcinica]MBF6537446.1 hypothetical protein [Nocardia farcinica]
MRALPTTDAEPPEKYVETDPLYRKGLEAAAAYDSAGGDQRRWKLLTVFGYGLLMIVEHWVRQGLQLGAVLFSATTVLMGMLETQHPLGRFGLVVAGLVGAALALVFMRPHWSWRWQYFVPAVVVGADALLMILWNQI